MRSSTKRLHYYYDSRGNRSALIDPDGWRFSYTYDMTNRLVQVQKHKGSGPASPTTPPAGDPADVAA